MGFFPIRLRRHTDRRSSAAAPPSLFRRALFTPWVEALEGRIAPAVFLVTNPLDNGSAGTFRRAILDANSNPGQDEIRFQIGGGGLQTIRPLSPLPTITGSVLLDGTTQPGYAGSPLIVLDGVSAGAGSHGLTVTASGSTIRGLVIHRFGGSGIVLNGAANTVIVSNYIGTDATGTSALGNASFGVQVAGGARFNRIGTNGDGINDATEGNVISGNRSYGIFITGATTRENIVAGNTIGIDVTGTVSLSNGFYGIWMNQGASFNRIGTNGDGIADPAERNLVSGNTSAGVVISDGQGNVVAGNYVGTDGTGTIPIANGSYGVWMLGTASNNRVGTNGDGVADQAEGNVVAGNGVAGVVFSAGAFRNTVAGNVISGNRSYGIFITGSSTRENILTGNYIGTDGTGTAAWGNGSYGIWITQGASLHRVGTNGDGIADQAERNVVASNGVAGVVFSAGAFQNTAAGNLVSGNGSYGIFITGSSTRENILTGNYIGTDGTGTAAWGNGSYGVWITEGASFNRVGTNGDGIADQAERNVVAGNRSAGIVIRDGRGNVVAGNYVGTEVTGTASLGNAEYGVWILGNAFDNRVGTNGDGIADQAERNLVAGNGSAGVLLSEGAFQNTVAGNHVGTDITGRHALGNGSYGIYISFAGSNLIGTNSDGIADEAERNLISSNGQVGIVLKRVHGARIAGNFIGTDVSGNAPLGNRNHGLWLLDSSGNTVGSDGDGVNDAAEGNLISGNVHDGLWITGAGSEYNLIAGNFIGTTVEGTVALPNGSHGVEIAEGARNNRIGGQGSLGNTIAFQGNGGVLIRDATTLGNVLRGNAIHRNAGLGIDLGDDGVSANDPLDADAGPNHLQNHPGLTSVQSGTTTRVRGTLHSLANTPFLLDFYASSVADSTGTGEGERYLGSGQVVTDGDGNVTFDSATFTFPLGATGAGEWITATATDPAGNTSEFSRAIPVHVTLSGRVFDDRDNDGQFDGSDTGLSGVPVTLFRESNLATPLASTATDASGGFTFTVDFASGSYRIVRGSVGGYLDGQETAGTLGGMVDNAHDSAVISGIAVGAGDAEAADYLFALIQPSRIQGMVWEDFNNDGAVNFGEQAIDAVALTLTGADDRGNPVVRTVATDALGVYAFAGLRPGSYTLTETQPAGFADGRDVLGTINGVPTGAATVNDQFSQLILPIPGSEGSHYNFGERPTAGGPVQPGQTATIGFWQNRNGQNLIRLLNGGPQATQLGNWLAATFPNLYGTLAGKTNAEVAAFYTTLFKQNGQTAPSGPSKLDAQVLAVALAVYVTNANLAGTVAAAYGFTVTDTGVGAATINVGAHGAAFGVADSSVVTVLDLLLATNARSRNAILYDVDGSGHVDSLERDLRTMANQVYTAINEQGDR